MKLALSNAEDPHNTPDPLSNKATNRRVRDVGFFAAGVLVYWVLVSFFSCFHGANIIRLSPFFVGAAGCFLGMRAGVLASVITIISHIVVFNRADLGGPSAVFRLYPAVHLGIAVLGPLTGYMRTKLRRISEELASRNEKGAVEDLAGVATDLPPQKRLEERHFSAVFDRMPPPATNQVFPGPSPGSETVLVAEDEPTVRRLILEVLSSMGYRVLQAVDGAEALEVAEQHKAPVHLLITDVVLPRMTGRELVTEFRARFSSLKVLYISGYIGKASVKIAELGPGTSFLSKPFATEALARKIRLLLDAPAPGKSRRQPRTRSLHHPAL